MQVAQQRVEPHRQRQRLAGGDRLTAAQFAVLDTQPGALAAGDFTVI